MAASNPRTKKLETQRKKTTAVEKMVERGWKNRAVKFISKRRRKAVVKNY
jgi:hypothetical protein